MANNDSIPQLPNLCHPPAILALVLVGELLSLVLVLADSAAFSWSQLGVTSIVVQWIILVSTMLLCLLRNWLNQLPIIMAGSLAYVLCLSVSVLVLWSAQWLQQINAFDWRLWSKQLFIAAILIGIFLRYLYVQQQLMLQKQAELQARIQSLQARIRPHFLFNSMNTIASLIDLDPKAAEKTLEDLSELFRASLQAPDLVSLCDEISLCRRYLAIEQRRLGERLSVQWQYHDPLPDLQIPSLVIQPLLENAIVHGIQQLPQGGDLCIVIRSCDDQIQILIDNPIPTSESVKAHSGNHTALNNIRARLQLYFQGKASLQHKMKNQRYSVQLNLPQGS